MNRRKKIVIVGATSAIATQCARLWLVQEPLDLYLVGRDAPRTERLAADLRVRSPQSEIRVVLGDFLRPDAIRDTVAATVQAGPVDIALIAHGWLAEQAACQNDLALGHEALEVNGVSPVLFAEAFASEMEKAGQGTIALIGSVAGDRGRKSNYVYGAAKGLVTRYAQGLQHRFAGTAIKVVLVKPGPTDTPMTAHLKAKGAKMASADKVAGDIVRAIAVGKPELYTPGKWWPVMRVVQHLPRMVFNRLDV